MKRIFVLCALVVGLVVAPSARANTYSLAFAGCLEPTLFGCATGVTNGTNPGGGTDILFTTNSAPGLFSFVGITGISGSVDIGSDTYQIGALATGLGGDNRLYGGLFGPTFDGAGVDFLLTNETGPASTDTYTELNITYNTVQGAYDYTVDHCTRGGCTQITKD